MTNELSEIGAGLAVVESFSHSVVLRTGDGLVAFDPPGVNTGTTVGEAIAGWTPEPPGGGRLRCREPARGVSHPRRRRLGRAGRPDDPPPAGRDLPIYEVRRDAEPSLMSKGIFAAAAKESQAVVTAAENDENPH